MAKKIGMVVAMESEMKHIYDTLGEVVAKESVAGFEITQFGYAGKDLYMISSGIGEVSAALATQVLVLNNGVELIINFGLVGSLKEEFVAKQVVVVREEVHYDWTFDTKDKNASGKYWHNRKNAVVPINMGKYANLVAEMGLKMVRIASGDKFINCSEMKNKIVEQFDCDVCDMESAGINLAGIVNNVPIIMFKAVSDNADESAEVDFTQVVESGVDFYINAVHKLLNAID